jgi:heme/copper-type cytochrome/quinol oxidase subunit 4
MKFVIGFILGVVLFTTATWLSGYNFDTRNFETACLFVMGLLVGYIGGLMLLMASQS